MREPGNMSKKEIIMIYIMFGIPSVLYRSIVGGVKPSDYTVLEGIFLWAVIFTLFYPWYRGCKK